MPKQIITSHKYRLLPDVSQKQYLENSFGCARFVWNKLVENFNSWTPELKTEPIGTKILTKEHEFLKDVSCIYLGQKERDFEQTKKQFFNKNRKIKLGRPKFKNKKGRQSIRVPGSLISTRSDFQNGLIVLPKFKTPFKFISHRQFEGRVWS